MQNIKYSASVLCHALLFLALTGMPFNDSFAQAYFQQEVNYTIDVTLDVDRHYLHGDISIQYINNSPDALDKIYMHLWANAYADQTTAFSHDMIARGFSEFYFSKDSDKGKIDSLAFRINGIETNWTQSEQSRDIALIFLSNDLASGDSLIITTPFRVKIPKSFSRMGRTGDDYQITQWYPKPAVYDRKGWHQMPYLAVGEFYSEFGDYDVSITLPDHYTIAATGLLQTKSELARLQALSQGTLTEPKRDSIKTFKTVKYQAKKVHDFAWFASPDYQLDIAKATTKNGVALPDIYIFYTAEQEDLWKDKALKYAQSSLGFFSKTVGAYPYPSMTVVQNPEQSGGGMEYPMITTIDQVGDAYELDHVIAHEVGHQWFYGILASNERDYPWMDEGLTTYYDHQYFLQQYGKDHFNSYLPGIVGKHVCRAATLEGYLAQASRHFDVGIEEDLSQISNENYITGAYAKPSAVFKYFESYVGTDRFHKWMRSFYEKWQFRHPQPDDLKAHLEQESGEQLDWLFELLRTDAYVDYKIKGYDKSSQQLSITNQNGTAAVVRLQAYNGKELLYDQWIAGSDGEQLIDLPQGDYKHFKLAVDSTSLDINLADNHYRPKALLNKRANGKVGFGFGPNDLSGKKGYINPYLGYNALDGLQLGMTTFSAFTPAPNFQDVFIFGYGLESKELVGSYRLRFNKYLKSEQPKHWHLDLFMKKFSRGYVRSIDRALNYFTITPSFHYQFKSSVNSPWKKEITVKSHLVTEEIPIFNNNSEVQILDQTSFVQQVDYNIRRPHTLYPYELNAGLEYSNYKNGVQERFDYLKLDASFTVDMRFRENKYAQIRFYAAGFIWNDQRNAGSTNPSLVKGSIPYAQQGFNDYYYESYLAGRSQQEGLWSRQVITDQGGGFKTATTSAFTSVGQSNDYLLAVNMKSDLPFKVPFGIPVKAFFDVAQYNGKSSIEADFDTRFIYSAGLALEFRNGLFGIYLPVINSNEIGIALDNRGSGLLKQWSFSLNLDKLKLWKILDRTGW